MSGEERFRLELENMARSLGSDLFGVADLSVAGDFIANQSGEYLRKFPHAISIGIRLLDAIVDELPAHEQVAVIHTYRGLYNTVNSRLDHIALLLARRIQEEGYQAYPVPASQVLDNTKLIGAISHKLAANLSGLGWIGKSALLVTPDYGPRVRFATILTNAPLAPASHTMKVRCGGCHECVKICPVKAFTGAPFDPSEPREARFKATMCYQYIEERRKKLGEGLCGLCVYVCPFGRKHKVVTG